MNTRKNIINAVVIFVSLSVVGIAMAVNARIVPDDFSRMVVVASGSAIFGSGLTFFLLRMHDLIGE